MMREDVTAMTITETRYGMRVRLDLPVDQAIERVTEALKAEGFGVLTTIDMQRTLKEKIDADIEPCVILGACNPGLAHRALQAEQEIGLLLPCNVIVYAEGQGSVVSALDPKAALGVVGTTALDEIAAEARARLARALEALVA